MKIKSIILFVMLILTAASLSGCMTASFSGNYVVRAGTTLTGDLFVTSGNVTLGENSRVTGTIIMTSGNLIIGRGASVGGNVVLTSGNVAMAEQSVVHGDIILASSDINVRQASGSRVEGRITNNIAPYALTTLLKITLLCCVLPLILLVGVFLLLGMWLGRITKRTPQAPVAPAPAPDTAPSPQEDAQAKLKQLKSMLDEGLITESDYEAKKADILAKM